MGHRKNGSGYELKYILDNYVNAEQPKSQKQIAEDLGITLGALKNFMYLHNLNKKKAYSKRNNEIIKYYNAGVSVDKISKLYGLSKTNIYTILGD